MIRNPLDDLPVEPEAQEPGDSEDQQLWHEGAALRAITGTAGWEVADRILKTIVDSNTKMLAQLDPWTPEIQKYHALAHAAHKIYEKFQEQVRLRVDMQDPRHVQLTRHQVLPE